MPVTVIADAGSPTANSFTTRAFADAWLNTQLYSEPWTSAADDTKDRALITATRLIVESLLDIKWRGLAVNSTQVLPFPRSGITTRTNYTLSSSEVPLDLQKATAKYARDLIALGQLPSTPDDAAGIRAIGLGSIRLEFDGTKPAYGYTRLPPDVWNMISYLVEPGAQGGTNVPLVRM